MKTITTLILLCFSTSSFSQLIAGNVPGGMTITSPSINLQLSTIMTSDSAFLDLDNDSDMDLKIILYCGGTALDVPNALNFYLSSQTKLMIEFSAVVFLKYKGAKIAFSGLNKAFCNA
jgi:hypothetical protein